ncbi:MULTISPECIES: DUF397 domain-containing protein [Streptomyces]|uniref:DUF397 domain-containing protein n=2 Tax=Streptomyces TaxID=1883 RepID=A0A3S9PIR5_STRLT|nr:DUF397 domain-containing protein [Streptomyces luteoverticillatus]AZQ72246.1 DUF397 domain-containing protein [Streptomyces luteoverticillatus]
MPETQWQRSSFCGGGGNNCLEMRPAIGLIQVRESEAPGTVIATPTDRITALIASVKAGRLR